MRGARRDVCAPPILLSRGLTAHDGERRRRPRRGALIWVAQWSWARRPSASPWVLGKQAADSSASSFVPRRISSCHSATCPSAWHLARPCIASWSGAFLPSPRADAQWSRRKTGKLAIPWPGCQWLPSARDLRRCLESKCSRAAFETERRSSLRRASSQSTSRSLYGKFS